METNTSDSLLTFLAMVVCLAVEWFFIQLLRSGLHTGKCSNAPAGFVDRAEQPFLYWFNIGMLALWVIFIPVVFVGMLIVAMSAS